MSELGKKFSVSFLAVFLMSTTLGIAMSAPITLAEEKNLTPSEVADLTKYSIVKIVHKIKGKATIPFIDVDLKNLSYSIRTDIPPKSIDVDEESFGSGVIVSPDGYILTNTHVVSPKYLKQFVAEEHASYALLDSIKKSGGFDKIIDDVVAAQVNNKSSNATGGNNVALGYQIQQYILDNSNFDIDNQVIVLNPYSKGNSLDELASKGFVAKEVAVNNDLDFNTRDIALIKIDQQDLPSIELGSSKDVTIGNKIFMFGYPGNAELSAMADLEPSFTQGTISATKPLGYEGFKVFQIDAKGSEGSSGGPLINEQGKIIGLTTCGTPDANKSGGDFFLYAIPADTIKEFLDNSKMGGEMRSFDIGGYGKHFLAGIDYLHNNQCKDAIDEFDLAKGGNTNFVISSNLDPYIKQCNDIIKSGKSVTPNKVAKATSGDIWWPILIIVVAIIAIAAASYWFIRMRRNEDNNGTEDL